MIRNQFSPASFDASCDWKYPSGVSTGERTYLSSDRNIVLRYSKVTIRRQGDKPRAATVDCRYGPGGMCVWMFPAPILVAEDGALTCGI